MNSCQGKCSEHIGSVVPVKVYGRWQDWGMFWYCENAIKEDRANGFIVDLLDKDEDL